jgi:dihydroneopterin aldolase
VDARHSGETDNPDDAYNYRTVAKAIIQHVEASGTIWSRNWRPL